MSDIKPKKSLRDIFPDHEKNPTDNSFLRQTNEEVAEDDFSPTPTRIRGGFDYEMVNPGRRRRFGWLIGIVAGVVVLGLGMVVYASYFSSAVVKVTPRHGQLTFSGSFSGIKSGITASSSALEFNTISGIEALAQKEVPASGTEKVEKKATGRIIIYNQNLTAQSLVATTRFQSADGRVYRITEPVKIPAGVKNGSDITPGTLEVSVTADKAGPEYNGKLTDFTIPGFAGSPKFKTVFARSKTEMAGGFVGLAKKISPQDIEANRMALEKELVTKLTEKLKSEVSTSSILFPDAIKVTFEEMPAGAEGNLPADKALLILKGRASAIIFDQSRFGQFFAEKLIPNYDGSPVLIRDANKLRFSLQNKDVISLDQVETISFGLDGVAPVIWTFDQNMLKNKLAGTSKKDNQAIFASFPAIEKVLAKVSPVWALSFPSDTEKIEIVENIES